jgi:hypothetical protein
MILDLAQSREHVALHAKHITRQHEIIAEVKRDGHDMTEARAPLVQREAMQVKAREASGQRGGKTLLTLPLRTSSVLRCGSCGTDGGTE